jgi:hypothetical protein
MMRTVLMALAVSVAVAQGASAAIVDLTVEPPYPLGDPWQVTAVCSPDSGGLAALRFTVLGNTGVLNIAPAVFDTRTAIEIVGWPGDWEIICAMDPGSPTYGVGQSGGVPIAQGVGMATLWPSPWRVTEAWVWESATSDQMVPATLQWHGPTFVPEPVSAALLATGVAGLALKRRRS